MTTEPNTLVQKFFGSVTKALKQTSWKMQLFFYLDLANLFVKTYQGRSQGVGPSGPFAQRRSAKSNKS